MAYESKTIVLASRPTGPLSEGNFNFTETIIGKPADNEVLLKARYFSVDPYMRNRMNDVKSYISPYTVGAPLESDAIAEVIESRHQDYRSGDLVYGNLPWQEYFTCEPNILHRIDSNSKINVTSYLGVLGLTGLTAYFGLLKIADPRPGETVVISAAAGAVGSIAGQIAKIKKCRVVGISGSAEKSIFLEQQLHFDAAINYRDFRNIRKPLRQACPDGVDVYFDNVGGDISDAVIYQLKDFARVVLCGQISLYNQNRLSMGPRLFPQFIVHRVKMQGFIVYDYKSEFDQARRTLYAWIEKGLIQVPETIVTGFEKLPESLLSLFKGFNTGKLLVRV